MSKPLAEGSDAHRDKEAVEAIVVRALRDPGAPPLATGGVDAAALVEAASRHRVLLLLGSTLRAVGTLERWPAAFIAAFQRAERDAVAMECVHHAELVTVLAALSASGVSVVLFKGAALAYSRYPAPHVRVRADTDLLVASADVERLETALQRLGYVRPVETSGRLVSYQSHYHKIDRYGVTHALDVHWRISNLQMLADRFTFEELWSRRVPLAALGPSAVTVDDVHALLLALLHRAGHHPGSRNLLWLYDLHVLVTRLTPEELSQVQEIAGERGIGHIVADGLALARDRFATARVGPVIDALRARAPRREDAVVVQGPWTQADVLRLDLDALRSWRARGRLILEHLIPSASYMRARYRVRSNVWLPGLYLWRALYGAPKWLRKRETD